MKKQLWVCCILVVLMLSIFSGCSKSDLEAYEKAKIKTDGVIQGKSSLSMSFGVEVADNQSIDFRYQEQRQFDYKEQKIISYGHTKVGENGYDNIFYQDGENNYLKLPFFPQYIRLNIQEQQKESTYAIDEVTIHKIQKAWEDVLLADEAVKENKVVITTEDGNIKTYKFNLDLDEANLLAFFEVVKNAIKDDINFNDNIEIDYSIFDHIKIENVVGEAFVDMDGYITQNNLELDLIFDTDKDKKNEKQLQKIHVAFQEKNWEIGEEQDIEIPVIKDEDIIDINNMKDFKGLEDFKGGFNHGDTTD